MTNSSEGKPSGFPTNPSLEHLRKQAKQLAKSSSNQKLTEVQHQLAKSYGFASWPKLVSHLKELKPSSGDREDSSQGYETDSRPEPDLAGIREDDLRALESALQSGDVERIVGVFHDDNSRGDPIAYWLRRYHGRLVDSFLEEHAALLTVHLAASFDQIGALRRLIEADASAAHELDKRERTPLDLAAHGGHSRSVRLLLDAGADPNAMQPLFYAAQNGYLGPARLLLAAGADINHPAESPLGRAVYRNRPGMVKLLLESGAQLDPDIVSSAAYGSRTRGKLHILKLLIDHGADLSYRDENGFNALYMQIWYYGPGPDGAITEFLIDAGCAVDLHAAAGLNLVDPLQEMLDAEPARVNEPLGPCNWTPLHFAANGGALHAADRLLSRGADANAVAQSINYTPSGPDSFVPHQLVRAPDGHFYTRDTSELKRLLVEAGEGLGNDSR